MPQWNSFNAIDADGFNNNVLDDRMNHYLHMSFIAVATGQWYEYIAHEIQKRVVRVEQQLYAKLATIPREGQRAKEKEKNESYFHFSIAANKQTNSPFSGGHV